MQLFYFSIKRKAVLVRQVELHKFLEFVGWEKVIKVIAFYGFIPPDRYYYETDLPSSLSARELLLFIQKHNFRLVEAINFESDSFTVEINDCTEYHLVANGPIETLLKQMLLFFADYEFSDTIQAQMLDEKYLLFQNGELIKTFLDFNEYVESHLE
jgi:hypothetical protein